MGFLGEPYTGSPFFVVEAVPVCLPIDHEHRGGAGYEGGGLSDRRGSSKLVVPWLISSKSKNKDKCNFYLAKNSDNISSGQVMLI